MIQLRGYSDRKLLMIALPLVLIAVIFASIGSIQTAHAAGFPGGPGLVCLNDATAAIGSPTNPCPATPYTFNGPFPSTPQISSTQVRVGVYVNGSAGLDGFDITLLTDHTVLVPTGVDLTGTVLLGTPVVVNECLQGLLIAGSSCFSTDTPDTLHLAATSQLGSPLTPSPTTGLLFTAIFSVVGTAPAGGIQVGFQTGCSTTTSVSGGVCVTVTNATKIPDAESVQTGTTFNNSGNTLPWIAETSNSSTIVAVPGASTGNSVAITTTAENGWPGPGFGSDSISFTAVASPGFVPPTLSATNCAPAACTIIATLYTGTGGTYSATIFGNYVALDSSGLTDSLIAPVTIQVTIRGIGWTINTVPFSSPQTDYLATSGTLPLIFTARSLGGYSGTITYMTDNFTDGGTGIVFTYPASFTIASGATVTQTIVAQATSEGAALYQATLSASGLPAQNSATLTIKVAGFALTTNTTSLTFNAGKSAGVLLTVTSLGNPPATNGFAGPVTISKTVTGPGTLTVSCKSPLSLTAGGSASGTCTFTGTTAGTYAVTLAGTGGTNKDITNSTSFTVTVLTVSGFKLAASPASLTFIAGTSGVSTITVSSSGSFSQAVSITALTYPSPLVCSLTPSSVTPPVGTSTTSTLSCSGPAGIYTVTLTGVSTGFSSQTATLHYTVQDFTLAAPAQSSIDAGFSTSSTISVTSLNGYAGTVALTAILPPGLSATFNTGSIPGGSGTSTLTLSAVVAGDYTVIVTGTSGPLAHSAIILVHVVDFQIFASPTMVSATPGVPVASMIDVIPLNSFAGTVGLTITISPATGLTCSVSPPSIAGGSGTSSLSCAGTGGTYNVAVSATEGFLAHVAIVTVNVQDFQITASPGSITVAQGGCTSNSVAVVSLGGFVGTISLTASTPTGISATLTPTSIVNSGTSTLTVCASTSAPAGSYSATVTGFSGSVSHQTSVAVAVVLGTSIAPPMISQGTWNHRFSLSKYNNVLTFKLGATNPSNVTEYVSLRVAATGNNGLSGFILNSPVITLAPGQNVVQVLLTQTFSQSQIGETFSFTISIQWGLTATTDPAQLPFDSTASNGQPTAGSFTVLA